MQPWQYLLKSSFTKLPELIAYLELDAEKQKELALTPFPLLLPRRLVEKIPKNTLDHPIARQFLPLLEENTPTGLLDAVGDLLAQKTGKLLQKYEGRALLMPTSACAMHCRFCFRRNYPYQKEPDYTQELRLLAQNPSIQEIILSGGDPLSLPDNKLALLIEQLSAIPHLKLLRFHTRFPIGIPASSTLIWAVSAQMTA